MHNEWIEILDWITESAFSAAARQYLKDQRIMTKTEAEKEFAMMAEADILTKAGTPFNYNLDRIGSVISAFDRDEPLETLDYRAVGDFLELMRLADTDIKKHAWIKEIDSLFIGIEPDISLEMTIKQTIDRKGEISSQASPELAKVRRYMGDTHERIGVEIKNMLKDPTTEGMLQEDYFTIRNDRYVMPFKTQYKRVIKGVVHNYSKTGLTAFLEPLALLDLNNQLSLLAAREAEEIAKVLKELRGLLYRKIDHVKQCFTLALHLEALHVKNNWMKKYNCVVPKFTEGKADITGAWYPPVFINLGPDTVKNNFLFSNEERIMVISGPNAGGKTVALKAFFCAAELSRKGFPVTADKAEIPFFDSIHFVLGDSQDATEGESSFSAHLKQLSKIAFEADTNSLILIDEIGTGTDPLQGGAIARAYLEFIKEKGMFAIVSSHLAEVKSIALEDKAFIPVAMGFDEKRDKPTYKFIYNLVGGSNALALVKKMSFPEQFVKKLEKLLLSREESVEPLINRLRHKEQEMDDEKARIDELVSGMESEKKEIETLRKRLADKEKDFEKERLRTLTRLMDMEETELKKRLEVFDIKKAPQRIAVIKREKEDLKQALDRETARQDDTEGEALADVLAAVVFNETVVYDKLMKIKGVLTSVKGRKAEINAAGKTLSAPVERLIVINEKIKRKVSSGMLKTVANYNERVDVRGLMGDDAKEKVERAVDAAYSGGADSLTIIHGHGTGVLKKAIREFLIAMSKNYAMEFMPAKQEEGGDGTTIVKFIK